MTAPDSTQPAAAEEADAVTCDSAAIAIAEIRLAPADTIRTTGLAVTDAITYDANRVSHIGSRTAGRIVTLSADVGETVVAGKVLAILESPEVGQTRTDEHQAEALLLIAQENFAREQRLEQQGIASRKELLTSAMKRSRCSIGAVSNHGMANLR